MPEKEFEKRLNLLKKAFYRKCLFCEVMVEGKGFEEKESKTFLRLCEFCSKKYEVIEELEQDKEASKKQVKEIDSCFYGKCYFCSEDTVKWEVRTGYSVSSSAFFGKRILNDKIDACHACSARYKVLCELECEKKKSENNNKF